MKMMEFRYATLFKLRKAFFFFFWMISTALICWHTNTFCTHNHKITKRKNWKQKKSPFNDNINRQQPRKQILEKQYFCFVSFWYRVFYKHFSLKEMKKNMPCELRNEGIINNSLLLSVFVRCY